MAMIHQSILLQEKSNISFFLKKNVKTPFLNHFHFFPRNWSNQNFLGKIWLCLAWILGLKRSPFMIKLVKNDQSVLRKVVNR